jgi:hypothetical protein
MQFVSSTEPFLSVGKDYERSDKRFIDILLAFIVPELLPSKIGSHIFMPFDPETKTRKLKRL